MLKSSHAVKLVGSLFIAFSFFVVYSTFTGSSVSTNLSDQKAQLVCIPPPGSVTCYNPTLPPGPVFSATSCVRYTIQDSGLTFLRYPDNFSSAYQIYPVSNAGTSTRISLGGGNFLSVINQATPSVLQNIRARFILTGSQALGNCPYVGAISLYINGTNFVPKANLIPGPYVPPEQYGYYSVLDTVEIVPLVTLLSESKTESLIEDISRDNQVNMTIDPNYDYRYSPSGYNNYFTPPMSNCVYIKAASGTPKDTIILTRDSRSSMSLPDFLNRVSDSGGVTASSTFSYYLDLKKRDQTTFLKTQSSCNTITNPEYVFLGDAPKITGIVVTNSTRNVAISGSWFLKKYNDIKLTNTANVAQEYILQNVASADNKTLQFFAPDTISGGNYSVRVRTFGGGWSSALLVTIPPVVDVCLPTISSPAFDPTYITDTQTNRGFTPALPLTPFDNFYVDFQFDSACPASRIAQMSPSLNLTISDDLVKVLKTGSLTRRGSTNTYRWNLIGWPNGIISDQALLVELLEHSAFSLPAMIELNEPGGIKSLATKDITMSSCVQVYGSAGIGQIPFAMIAAERFGDDGVVDRGLEGTAFLAKVIENSNSLFNTDPFKKYKSKFVLYADLKPISFKNDVSQWIYGSDRAPISYGNIAKKFSSCKFDTRVYALVGEKIIEKDFAGGPLPAGAASLDGIVIDKKYFSFSVFGHELGHAFGRLEDEYVSGNADAKGPQFTGGSNCTKNPTTDYAYEGKLYGSSDEYGCAYDNGINKPSANSIMDGSHTNNKFNKISCAYIIKAIKGGDPKSYYTECAGLDVVDPGENIPGVPITVLTQQINEVWLSGNTYQVRWSMPTGFSPVGVQSMVVSIINQDGVVKAYYQDATPEALTGFRVNISVNDFLLNHAPPGNYAISVRVVPKQPGIDTGYSDGNITIRLAEPAPVVNVPPVGITPVTPGSSKTINGSGFTPTGNKIQLTKTGPVSIAPQSLFQKFAFFITKGVTNVASVIGASVTPAPTSADPVTTYEIKDIPSSNGTSLTFTIPANIPPGIYTMKVAGLNSNYSEGITITVASPKSAPCGTVGDLNNDHIITQTDHDLLMQVIGGNTPLTPAVLTASDLNGDGEVIVTDGTMLLRFLSGVITTFPACSMLPAPVITSLNHTSSVVGSWIIAQGSGFSSSTITNTDKVEFSNGTQTVEGVAGVSASATGDFYVDPSLPNLTFGNYSAFRVPTNFTPGVYSVRIARQNGLWSSPLNFTVLPAQNPNGTYNFAYTIASQRPPDVVYTDPRQNYVVTPEPVDSTPTQEVSGENATLIAKLLTLIQQLTAQLEALKAGKTEMSKNIPVVTTPTTTPSILPTTPATVCTQEVTQCPDGSFVGRVPPTCAFQTCPITTLPPTPTFACPTDTSPCSDGTTVSRIPPLCLFAACPNPFTPPPPVVVTPPPPVVTPTVVTPPPPTVTITPPPSTPTVTEPTLSASLSPVYEDRAGPWGSFAPAAGSIYGSSRGDIHDFVWNATLTLSSSKTIRAINLTHNTRGEYWSTDNANAYPLVIFQNGTQLNTAYSQTLGTYGAGTTNLIIYGQFETPTFSGGTLTITFTDNTSVTATVPASSFSPCTTCTSQTSAVFEALGDLVSVWWREVVGTFAR